MKEYKCIVYIKILYFLFFKVKVKVKFKKLGNIDKNATFEQETILYFLEEKNWLKNTVYVKKKENMTSRIKIYVFDEISFLNSNFRSNMNFKVKNL